MIGPKVQHVLKSKQTREHHCHWPGCQENVPPARWGCRKHWYMLPKTIRDRIWEAYRPGQEVDMQPSTDYLVIARAAQDWIKLHYPQPQGEQP